MKIVSFNINGLNAFYNKGKLEKIISETDADIYCFQETKVSKAKIENMKNIFSSFPLYKDYNCICTVKNGYAGVTVLIHNRILDRVVNSYYPNILSDVKDFENYGDGRIVVIEFNDFYLISAYVINSGNKMEARIHFDEMMIQFLSNLDKPYIYCGDMNVCSTKFDYWGNYEMYKNSAPGLCQFEIDGFAKIINECNLVDAYRYKNGNKKEYTWFSPMGSNTYSNCKLRRGWRIDYFLVSESLKDKIENSKIYEGWNEKDHSPIELEINI